MGIVHNDVTLRQPAFIRALLSVFFAEIIGAEAVGSPSALRREEVHRGHGVQAGHRQEATSGAKLEPGLVNGGDASTTRNQNEDVASRSAVPEESLFNTEFSETDAAVNSSAKLVQFHDSVFFQVGSDKHPAAHKKGTKAVKGGARRRYRYRFSSRRHAARGKEAARRPVRGAAPAAAAAAVAAAAAAEAEKQAEAQAEAEAEAEVEAEEQAEAELDAEFESELKDELAHEQDGEETAEESDREDPTRVLEDSEQKNAAKASPGGTRLMRSERNDSGDAPVADTTVPSVADPDAPTPAPTPSTPANNTEVAEDGLEIGDAVAAAIATGGGAAAKLRREVAAVPAGTSSFGTGVAARRGGGGPSPELSAGNIGAAEVADQRDPMPVLVAGAVLVLIVAVCCIKYIRLSLSACATRLWDPPPVRDCDLRPAASTPHATATEAPSVANSEKKKRRVSSGSSPMRARVEELSRCSADDVVQQLPVACSYDCALSKPLRSRCVLRLEVQVAEPLGPSARPLVAPLTEQECVIFSATVFKRVRGQGLALSFAASNVDFHVTLLDDPSTHIEVMGMDVSMFEMYTGRFVQTGTFATAPDHYRAFVMNNQVEAAKLRHDELTTEDAPLEFQESALLIGSKITLVGELCRGPSGTLMLQPLEPEWSGKEPPESHDSCVELAATAAVLADSGGTAETSEPSLTPAQSDSEESSAAVPASSPGNGITQSASVSKNEDSCRFKAKRRFTGPSSGLTRTVLASDDPNLLGFDGQS